MCSPRLIHRKCPVAGMGLSFTTFVNTVPINENRTVNRFALVRNLNSPLAPGAVNAVFNAGLWDRLAHNAMIKCDPALLGTGGACAAAAGAYPCLCSQIM